MYEPTNQNLRYLQKPIIIAYGSERVKLVYSRETSPLILIPLQITLSICSVGIEVVFLICDTSQWNTYNENYRDETKQMLQWRSESRTQENQTTDHKVYFLDNYDNYLKSDNRWNFSRHRLICHWFVHYLGEILLNDVWKLRINTVRSIPYICIDVHHRDSNHDCNKQTFPDRHAFCRAKKYSKNWKLYFFSRYNLRKKYSFLFIVTDSKMLCLTSKDFFWKETGIYVSVLKYHQFDVNWRI